MWFINYVCTLQSITKEYQSAKQKHFSPDSKQTSVDSLWQDYKNYTEKKRGSSLISYSRKFRNSKKGHPYKQSPQLLTYILPIARAKGELTYSCGPRGKKDVGIFLHVQWKLSPTTVAWSTTMRLSSSVARHFQRRTLKRNLKCLPN
jgi:hypothetical protein